MSIGMEWGEKVGAAFIRHVHELIAWGHSDIRKEIGPAMEEEVISQYLALAIRNRIIDSDGPHNKYVVSNEPSVLDGQKTGKRRDEIDLWIESTLIQTHPQFICEAKRLRTNGFPISEYTGEGGMQCFLAEKYAIGSPAAAMLAYVQSDDAGRWFKELERKFEEDAQDELKIVQKLCPCPVIDELPNEWLSEHRRKTKSPIKIYHIFLDCQ